MVHIFNWAVNALKVYKDSNQDIPLKLPGMVLTVLTKDNVHKKSKSNELILIASVYVLLTVIR